MKAKKYVLERLIALNTGAEISISNDGFIWVDLPKDQSFQIPQKYTCAEGLEILPNSMTLRHLYNSNGEFIVTAIVRA